MSKMVMVLLTPAQARAVNAALAYCTAGTPEDGGLTDHAQLRAAENARATVCAAMRVSGVEP